MARERNPNLVMLELTVEYLGPLAEQMVFLGGCATGLLVTDPAAPPVRPTTDVDVIVEVGTRAGYYQLAEQLRARGFHEDTSDDAPLCRWTRKQLQLDVMPTREDILGFANPWYPLALQTATPTSLPSGAVISMVTAPCFVATKLAAFAGRGQGDYMASHDMEDLVAVLDGRPELAQEIQQAPDDLRHHLVERVAALLADSGFVQAIPGHLPADLASQGRVPMLMERLQTIAGW